MQSPPTLEIVTPMWHTTTSEFDVLRNEENVVWEFSVITGESVDLILQEHRAAVVDIVREAYLAHAAGRVDDTPSQFLRFKNLPDARIISLPASLDYGEPVSGIKWIASYPGNVPFNLPRASAVLVLNRRDNGHPFSIMEASTISAARTAASAVLAADTIGRFPSKRCTFGIVGCGPIARHTLEMFLATGWRFDRVLLFDTVAASAAQFQSACQMRDTPIQRCESIEQLLSSAPLVMFATSAAAPHVDSPSLLRQDSTVLHVSLRDLSPAVILQSTNIVDDVDHCLRANTSLHLTEQQCSHRDFVAGTLAQLLQGRLRLPADRPVVFSPFGMGMLDIAVGRFVHEQASQRGSTLPIDNFFHTRNRHRSLDHQ